MRKGKTLRHKMVYNAGLRSVAKIILNNVWGKLRKAPNKIQIQDFTEHQKLTEFLDSGEIDDCSIDVVTDGTVEVYYKKTSKLKTIYLPSMSIFLGLFYHLLGPFSFVLSPRIAPGTLFVFGHRFCGDYERAKATESTTQAIFERAQR